MGKKVTIKDVAEEANVSAGTVSAVINGKESVKEETQRQVLYVIERLGYRPSKSAQNLGSKETKKGQKSKTVGVIVKEIENPFYSQVIKGVRDYLSSKGYRMHLCTSEGDYKQEGIIISSLRSLNLSGAIVAPVLTENVDLSHLFTMRKTEFPFVLFESVQGLKTDVVSIDNEEAGKNSILHLTNLGHEKIAYLRGPEYTQHTRDREKGVMEAFNEADLDLSKSNVIDAGAYAEDGFDATMKLFKKVDEVNTPTAIACFNDLVAIGVLDALSELDIDIPDDVSVIGCDDIWTTDYLSPSLTSVHAPKYQMGEKAAQLLIDRVTGKSKMDQCRKINLNSHVVSRKSTSRIA